MKRLIDWYLLNWKTDPMRQPLIIRGARQVGKTYAVRKLAAQFPNFVEINLERSQEAHKIFKGDLEPVMILERLSLLAGKAIIPGKTLLFLDEMQAVPESLLAFRYFYEDIPELHVIGAGSLLDFAIEHVGLPVGRVECLHVHPVSFIEFLAACDELPLLLMIRKHDLHKSVDSVIHNKALSLVAQYIALGGMPQVVDCWSSTKKALDCAKVHKRLLEAYKGDFGKYARTQQAKYVDRLFLEIPRQLGSKFVYSRVDGDYRKRELSPALDLLEMAGVVHRIYASSGQGVPLGAQVNPHDYKVFFLDVGLAQALLSLDIAQWFIDPPMAYINKGAIVEAFVGQELLAYSDPQKRSSLYYWRRNVRGSSAEIDYLMQRAQEIIPLEVKSGSGTTLRSLHQFLESHPATSYGLRCSTQNYSKLDNIASYPLYALAACAIDPSTDMWRAWEYLAS